MFQRPDYADKTLLFFLTGVQETLFFTLKHGFISCCYCCCSHINTFPVNFRLSYTQKFNGNNAPCTLRDFAKRSDICMYVCIARSIYIYIMYVYVWAAEGAWSKALQKTLVVVVIKIAIKLLLHLLVAKTTKKQCGWPRKQASNKKYDRNAKEKENMCWKQLWWPEQIIFRLHNQWT